MKIKRQYAPFDDGWQERILIIWVEDDAPAPDKETADAALFRLSGRKRDQAVEKIVEDDCFTYLFIDGWVMSTYPEGADIGVVYKED